MTWLRRHPLAAFLPFQALMYFWNLKLLSPWSDEAYAFQTMHLPVGSLLNSLAHDFHPPGYYLLLYGWLRLPFGLDWEVQARAFSGVCALVAFAAADRLWASRLGERGRICFLALWSVSPCLLLYARMCHSFCLQLLVGTVVAALIMRFADERSNRNGVWLAAGLTAALYIHYVPGIALLAAANLFLLRKRRLRDALAVDLAVAVAYLPWGWWLFRALKAWSSHPPNYFLTGSVIAEVPVRLAYWAMSFVIGEAQPDALLIIGAGVVLLVGGLAVAGARRNRPVAWLVAPMALIGFVGIARWVAYPFLPARMLFLFPLLLLLFVEGALAHRRAGNIAIWSVMALSVSGVWCYSHRIDFRNKQYIMPLREIAAEIREHSAHDAPVLVDTPNSDIVALSYCLGNSRRVLDTRDPETEQAIAAVLADPRVRTIWFLRSTHDVTPQKLDNRFEAQLRGSGMKANVQQFGKFSALERSAMRIVGINPPPGYFQELLKFER
ncbi:MAG TPA: hypothetical protein VLY04_15990 [Bryobacteraceae bacterium]|nr:hypothetical protein [Bryobacteraceae bacterium]